MANLVSTYDLFDDEERELCQLLRQTWSFGTTVEASDDYRAQASLCAQRRNEFFARSREAWRLGNKAEAKSLSNEAKAQAKLMAEANQKAAETVFDHNNATRDVGVLDLHGLFVKEAIEKVEQRIALCKEMGRIDMVVIVGKGKHSRNGNAVLKPMVEELMHKHGLSITVGKPNDGCIYVAFDNRGTFLNLMETFSHVMEQTCAVM